MSRHFIGLHQTVYKGPVTCYFHLYQIVIRKVNEIGLKLEYETNDEVRNYVRCLPALTFILPDDVMKAFEFLDESQPTTVDQLDELTTFFEHTYIRGRTCSHIPRRNLKSLSTLQGRGV